VTAFNRLITRHPWPTIAAFVLVTAVFAARLPELRIDFDVDTMLPSEHPEIVYKNWATDYFGVDEPVAVTVVNDGPDGIFNPATLALVEFLSTEMMELAELHGDDLVSLSEVDDITSDGDMLIVEPFFDEAPATQDEADAIRRAVFGNPMMVGSVVSEDGQATIVAAEMAPDADKKILYRTLEAIVARAPVTNESVTIAGRPVVEGEMTTINEADLQRLMPFVIVAVSLVLWVTLRCVRGVLLPLLVVVCAVIWTLGAMAWSGRPLSALNGITPTILIPIGIADGIHVIHHFLRTVAIRPQQSAAESTFETMQHMTTAIVMTSITTAAGIGALVISSLEPSREFAICTSFGVLVAMVCSLTLLPAILAVLPLSDRTRAHAAAVYRKSRGGGGILAKLASAASTLVTHRPGLAIASGVAVVAVSAIGMPWVVVDGSLVDNLPPGNPVRVADAVAVERFGGSVPVEIVLDGGGVDAWKDPARLREVERFQDWLEAGGQTGATRSIVDYLKRMNAVMHPDDPGAYRVPDSADLVAQYLLLYSISGQPDDFDDVVDYDYALANVRAQVNSDHSPVLASFLAEIEDYADQHLEPAGIEVHASGVARQMHVLMDLIIGGQIGSLVIALPFVVIVAGLMLSSVSGGLLTVLPVVMATVVTFGLLGWSGVALGVTTSVMGSLGIGIGVDYAVHFVVRYRQTRSSGLSPEKAMLATMDSAGVAILYNALVVIAGFLVLTTSGFLPPKAMGWLVSLNMLVCFLATTTTLAAIIHRRQPPFVLGAVADQAEDDAAAELAHGASAPAELGAEAG